MNKELFNKNIKELIDKVYTEEKENIEKAAKIIFDSFLDKKVLQVFATGHTHMIAEEMFYRAGGLIQVNPILRPFLMQHEGAVSSTKYERLTGIAEIIYNGLDLKEGEVFLIASNSGINAVPVEMAKIAKENKHPVIVITSLESSKKLKARTIDGKRLYDYADIVIDNKCPYGDGLIDSKYGKVGSASSIIGNYIVQSIVLEIIDLYDKANLDPSIYFSANTPGGDEHNIKDMKEYKQRIKDLF